MPPTPLKFAAIDIGSNAVRLLFCNVFQHNGEPVFKKYDLIRIPIRLGEDSFLHQYISESKSRDLLKTMQAFKLLMEVEQPVAYRACATSAMRDATNGQDVIETIRQRAGITIEIIDGSTEAQLIYQNHIEEHLDKNKSYLYVDVGGGSTELTLFSNKKHIFSRSFNIGTVRVLHNRVSKEQWKDFAGWIKENTKKYSPLIAIGSGGNINKLFKMSGKKDGKYLTLPKLHELADSITQYTLQQRIETLGLKPDRADVIIPAATIYQTVMKNADISKMLVPQIGLSDGIVHDLYEQYTSGNKVFSAFAQDRTASPCT